MPYFYLKKQAREPTPLLQLLARNAPETLAKTPKSTLRNPPPPVRQAGGGEEGGWLGWLGWAGWVTAEAGLAGLAGLAARLAGWLG